MQNKILSYLRKNYPHFLFVITMLLFVFSEFKFKLMNLNAKKKNSIHEIKKELKKSKLKVLTNENDFLVKTLQKAG